MAASSTPPELVALPKVDLHCHVDGAARPETLLELARQNDVALPADTQQVEWNNHRGELVAMMARRGCASSVCPSLKP